MWVWEDPQCCLWHTLLNRIDYRYWRCECHYDCEWGFVIEAGCKYHD